ncbi:MAG: hypothetical protein QXN78_01920, partial [Conexivisphaerales archaeon]
MGKKIRVALAGIGNTASAIVQGTHYYSEGKRAIGVMSEEIGGYKISDIEFVAAFDISSRKVGKDLADAIFESPNLTPKYAEVPKTGVEVSAGPVHDGVAPHMVESFSPISKDGTEDEVAKKLKDSGADMLINLLPVGSEKATKSYARAAIRATTAFINGIPV